MATVVIVALLAVGVWIVAGFLSRTRSGSDVDEMTRAEHAALRAGDMVAPVGMFYGTQSGGTDFGVSDGGGFDAGGGDGGGGC